MESRDGGRDECIGPIRIPPRNIKNLQRISSRNKGIFSIRKIKRKKIHELKGTHAKHVIRMIGNVIMRTAESFLPKEATPQGCKIVWIGKMRRPFRVSA